MWQAQNKRRSIVKRGLKKNQVMIAALAVMIAAAGYLNYTGRLFGTEKDDTTQTSADLTNQELLDISEEDTATGSEDILSNDSETEGTPVSYTHLRAHETDSYLVCRLLLEKKKNKRYKTLLDTSTTATIT